MKYNKIIYSLGIATVFLIWWLQPLIVGMYRCGSSGKFYVETFSFQFCVPTNNVLFPPNGKSFFPLREKSLDNNDDQIIFSIPQRELIEHFKNYTANISKSGSIIENFNFLVYFLSKNEFSRQRYITNSMQDFIFGKGGYANYEKVIEPISGESNWFRLYYKYISEKKAPSTWVVLSGYPNHNMEFQTKSEFLIGSCLKFSIDNNSCSVRYLNEIHNIAIDFDVPEKSLKLKDKIGDHLIKKLFLWKRYKPTSEK